MENKNHSFSELANQLSQYLSSASGRKDENPNIQLAENISREADPLMVDALFEMLEYGKSKTKNDVIKVIYELGERNPGLIENYTPILLEKLNDKHTRLVWGSMTALNTVAHLQLDLLLKNINLLKSVMDHSGSVIARDHGFNILVKLMTKFPQKVWPYVVEVLSNAPINQFATYAEKSANSLPQKEIPIFLEIIRLRYNEMNTEAKQKRLMKLINKLND